MKRTWTIVIWAALYLSSVIGTITYCVLHDDVWPAVLVMLMLIANELDVLNRKSGSEGKVVRARRAMFVHDRVETMTRKQARERGYIEV